MSEHVTDLIDLPFAAVQLSGHDGKVIMVASNCGWTTTSSWHKVKVGIKVVREFCMSSLVLSTRGLVLLAACCSLYTVFLF